MSSDVFAILVENIPRLALTGTPGTGKTTSAELLEGMGMSVVTMEGLAELHGCIGNVDIRDNARPVDIDSLCSLLVKEWSINPESPLVVDGHLSHHLPIDGIILLRCSPDVLRERLAKRGYSEEKIVANLEWEILGGAWNEVSGEVPIVEIDTSAIPPEGVVGAISGWISDDFKPSDPSSAIDWVE
ncbi:MAG TPA: AAA family ATPase [Candidatus Thalassarchaeaceae archaeon]|jgi:adenylate kinase|nr:AAA family ATPase [Candidatus Thalassarchaeaceae archaeon]|tara:strand:- start:56188 stop:56745 length:558 start_codon:yes stop_codon:yes gene_type:complete